MPSAVRLASRIRGERIIHGKGRAFTGVLDVSGADLGVPLLDEPGRYDVLIRLSRGAGLPDLLPDALGLAVRVLDAHGAGQHQDLLLTTGAEQPLVRHALVPRWDLLGSTYTSVAPYRLAGEAWLVGALPVDGQPRATSVHAVQPDQVAFTLAVARTRGPWQAWGRLQGTGLAIDGRSIGFSPETSGGGIEPPWLAARGGAYRASHTGTDTGRDA